MFEKFLETGDPVKFPRTIRNPDFKKGKESQVIVKFVSRFVWMVLI